MGAWGYEALDSDAALDWLGDITYHAGTQIESLLTKFEQKQERNGAGYAAEYYANEIRAAAFVVEKLNFFTVFDDLHGRLAKALRAIVNSPWPNEWDNPQAVKDSILVQIEAMEAGMHPTTLMDNLDLDK